MQSRLRVRYPRPRSQLESPSQHRYRRAIVGTMRLRVLLSNGDHLMVFVSAWASLDKELESEMGWDSKKHRVSRRKHRFWKTVMQNPMYPT